MAFSFVQYEAVHFQIYLKNTSFTLRTDHETSYLTKLRLTDMLISLKQRPAASAITSVHTVWSLDELR